MKGGEISARRWAATLVMIVAGGAALRLAGLGAESVDLEEYACIGALHTRGLHQFLAEQRILYPYGAPLAPLLYYLWSGLFGVDVIAVRLLSAAVGTVLIVVTALLAREIWPVDTRTARTAGLIAALCVALSPVHLFQAQEARMYAFVALFAAMSGLSLLLAARTGRRRWWALNLAANAALVWSHYLAAFLWPAQALWLLFAKGVRRRVLLFWLTAHALLLAPVGMWMSGIAPQPSELHEYYIKPDLSLVLRNLVAGDAVNWSSSTFFPSGRAWSFAPDAVRQAVVSAHPAADIVIAAAFSAALLWGLLRLFRKRADPGAHPRYLTLWAVVPLVLLVFLSFAWKPVYASRYLVHASLALYLLLGGLLARLPAGRRALCVAALTVVYGWQLSLVLPPQTRTAWKQTAAAIEAADGAQAIALVQGVFWKPVFEANLPSSQAIVTAVLRPESMAGMGAFLTKAIAAVEPGTNPSCWAVLVDTIHGQSEQFESVAASCGVRLERRGFPGERRLDVYRISPAPEAVREGVDPSPAVLLRIAGIIAARPNDPAVKAFQETVRAATDRDGGAYARLGVVLAQRGRVALAAAVLDEALAWYPPYLVDLVRMEPCAWRQDDFGILAGHAFSRMKVPPEEMPALRQMLDNLLDGDGLEVTADVARRMIRAFPNHALGHACLGRLESHLGRNEEALRDLEHAMALDPAQSGRVYCALGNLYLGTGRCPEALRLLEQGYRHDPADHDLALLLADAHINCGDAERAVALAAAEFGREEWANCVTPVATVHGKTATAVPSAYSDLARAISEHSEDPAVTGFLKAKRAYAGLAWDESLQLGVDLARRGNVDWAATVLNAAACRFPFYLLDLALLLDSLPGGHAK